ncbi:hypothetical protein PC114_g19027, partial [Phytophthora cactorum]
AGSGRMTTIPLMGSGMMPRDCLSRGGRVKQAVVVEEDRGGLERGSRSSGARYRCCAGEHRYCDVAVRERGGSGSSRAEFK